MKQNVYFVSGIDTDAGKSYEKPHGEQALLPM